MANEEKKRGVVTLDIQTKGSRIVATKATMPVLTMFEQDRRCKNAEVTSYLRKNKMIKLTESANVMQLVEGVEVEVYIAIIHNRGGSTGKSYMITYDKERRECEIRRE